MYSETDFSDMDAKENKEQFALGFKDVQESFYDLCSKLEKTQTGITLRLSPWIAFRTFPRKISEIENLRKYCYFREWTFKNYLKVLDQSKFGSICTLRTNFLYASIKKPLIIEKKMKNSYFWLRERSQSSCSWEFILIRITNFYLALAEFMHLALAEINKLRVRDSFANHARARLINLSVRV